MSAFRHKPDVAIASDTGRCYENFYSVVSEGYWRKTPSTAGSSFGQWRVPSLRRVTGIMVRHPGSAAPRVRIDWLVSARNARRRPTLARPSRPANGPRDICSNLPSQQTKDARNASKSWRSTLARQSCPTRALMASPLLSTVVPDLTLLESYTGWFLRSASDTTLVRERLSAKTIDLLAFRRSGSS